MNEPRDPGACGGEQKCFVYIGKCILYGCWMIAEAIKVLNKVEPTKKP